ncbi:MAG: peroxiredoxin [Candidatus Gracilibacteria bacterium]|nr:peroxiredoxin [Candidatus Gracilibacteria bacterium]
MNLNNKYNILLPNGKVESKSLKDILSVSDKTIVYFYPKDDTPGCTIENKDFSCLKGEFEKAGYGLVGVSKDSIESHKDFIKKHELGVSLISDPELVLHKELGAYGEKNNYGKIVEGVIRSTFLVDKAGNILKEWRNIKAGGHVERLLKELN